MEERVIKRYDLEITEADKPAFDTFELDKNIAFVKGVLVTSSHDEHLYYRGSQKIEINKAEVFPEDYESKLLYSGVNVPPSLRYYDLGDVPAGNGQIKVSYVDREDARAPFTAYRVSYYFTCVLKPEEC